LYFAIACFTAYYFSGHSGIYSAQRVMVAKTADQGFQKETLKHIREKGLRGGRVFEVTYAYFIIN